jgi:hypothetical protein
MAPSLLKDQRSPHFKGGGPGKIKDIGGDVERSIFENWKK